MGQTTGLRAIATSPVLAHMPARGDTCQKKTCSLLDTPRIRAVAGYTATAGSPLFLTDLDSPMMWSEIQFILSGPINGLFERMFETEAGPLFLNAVCMVTLLRMAVYYGFLQPSYLWHFQERYGQSWTVGHHLYGCSLSNPLKKGGK